MQNFNFIHDTSCIRHVKLENLKEKRTFGAMGAVERIISYYNLLQIPGHEDLN
jgi:hypothetical protein